MPRIAPKPVPTPEVSGGKTSRDRSPSFPFVPLQTAIERLTAFEKYFGRRPAPVTHAGLAWGMKGKSSQADQTLAALRSFGLIEYEGSGVDRKAIISEDGRTYLRTQQETTKRQVLKRAALRPKNIRKFWSIWGTGRHPDPVCLDELIFKNGFSDTGAESFLKVYDATIAYAGLADSDKIDLEVGEGDEDAGEPDASSEPHREEPLAIPPQRAKGKVPLMAGERELTAGLLSKETDFRLIVRGHVGVKEIDMLIKKLTLDKEILADTTESDGSCDPFKG